MNPAERHAYINRQMAIMDYNSDIADAKEEGRVEGRAEGITEGRNEETKNTILRLWKKGKSLADIVDATDWSPEKINEFLRSRNLRPAR